MPIQKNFDKNFFKQWSGDMTYILGFLFADGNIIKTKRNTHFVSLYTSDYELLSSMAASIRSNHKISLHNSKTGCVYRIQIGSKELFEDLFRLGLVPNKAARMKFPEIPSKFSGDFIRGYFDGDGNVWTGILNKHRKKPTQAIQTSFTSASILFLHGLHEYLHKLGIKGGCLYKIKLKKCGRLSFSTNDSLKMYKIMYNDRNELFLARKKLVFEDFIKMRL